MKPPLFSCLESRVLDNGSLYGRFLFGPLPIDLSLTVATSLRRSLLHNQPTFTIVSAEIEGADHEYASLPGIQESVLEILLNLGEISLTTSQGNLLSSNFRSGIEPASFYFASIKIAGPHIVLAKDINWPKGIFCVKPESYIATLSSNETFHMLLKIAPSPFLKPLKNVNLDEINTQLPISSSNPEQLSSIKAPFFEVKNQSEQKNLLTTQTTPIFYNSIQKEDYTPLSSYSARKRDLVDMEKTSFLNFQGSSSIRSELTSVDFSNQKQPLNLNSVDPVGPLSYDQSQIFYKKKATLAFGVFPRFNKSLSKPKNEDKTFQETISSGLNLQKNTSNTKYSKTETFLNDFEKNKKSKEPLLNLPKKQTLPLSVKSSSYPVEKVNFLIERDDELAGYRHRIILEVWTNGTISPRQAIFDSIGSLIKLIYSFREPVRSFKTP